MAPPLHERGEARAPCAPGAGGGPGRGAGGRACGRARSRRPRRASPAIFSYVSQREVAVGPGAPNEGEQRALVPGIHRAGRRRSAGRARRAGFCGIRTASSLPSCTARSSAAHSTSSSRVRAKRMPLRDPGHVVAGAPHALEEERRWSAGSRAARRGPPRRCRCRARARRWRTITLQLAPLEPLLGREPQLARHAAVVGGDESSARGARPGRGPRARRACGCW